MSIEVSSEQNGRVIYWDFARPESLNALDRQSIEALQQCISQVEQQVEDKENRCDVLILRSTSPKAFIAGADIKYMRNCAPSDFKQFLQIAQAVMRRIEELPIPTLSLVKGFALGGGLEVALSTDLIIASDQAAFGLPETTLGLIPGFGGTQRLTWKIGAARAKAMMLTGEKVAAEQAYDWGIADYLFSSEEYDQKVEKLTSKLLTTGPVAQRRAKKLVDWHRNSIVLQGLFEEEKAFLEVAATEDAIEGMDAFVEKRKAEFKYR